jgi:hypothetical protein
MNCCDEYNNCQQGRNCPIRKERVRQAKELLDGKPTPASKQVTWALWAFIVLMLGLMTLRSCL